MRLKSIDPHLRPDVPRRVVGSSPQASEIPGLGVFGDPDKALEDHMPIHETTGC
jgi:hypothetical protein